MEKLILKELNKEFDQQQLFCKIANFGGNSCLSFARNFIFSRKYLKYEFATSKVKSIKTDKKKNS
jgi:ferritin